MRSTRLLRTYATCALLAALASPAAAQTASPAAAQGQASTPAASVDARKEFLDGTALLQQSNWAEALAAFERAAKLRPHPVTTYNIAACQRALGQYVRARGTFVRALTENTAAGGAELSGLLVMDIGALITEIDGLIATASVTLEPADATVAIDGRPLEVRRETGGALRLYAGTRAPGAGEAPPSGDFTLVIDPGVHVITLARKGFAEVIVSRDFPTAKRTTLRLELDRLPTTFHIASNEPGAIVYVNGTDVGAAPVDLQRAPGSYRVVVSRPGFDSYEAQILAKPGDEVSLQASLRKEKVALTQRWWFWTGVGAVLVGAAATTYLLTRPDPTRPDVNSGGLNWAVPVR